MEEFLIGQHPVATFLALVALGLFMIWCVHRWRERPQGTVIKRMDNLNKARKQVLRDLPVYKGHTYETECTCALYAPAKVKLRGSWKRVCSSCGSLRRNTGT